MNNLINKAIQAIKDGKNDYAIGLLEGILEMNSKEGFTYIPPKTITPSPKVNLPLEPYMYTYTEVSPATNGSNDEGVMLDKVAAAKLEEIKRVANIQVL